MNGAETLRVCLMAPAHIPGRAWLLSQSVLVTNGRGDLADGEIERSRVVVGVVDDPAHHHRGVEKVEEQIELIDEQEVVSDDRVDDGPSVRQPDA